MKLEIVLAIVTFKYQWQSIDIGVIKHDIKQVDVSPNGTNIYEFKYVGAEGTYRGVMADEVPWAVEEGPSGYQMVDYSKVDVDFVRVG